MRPQETVSSPVFPHLDPIVLDVDMNSLYHDGDMEFLNNGDYQHTSNDSARDLNELFPHSAESRNGNGIESSASPAGFKGKTQPQGPGSLKRPHAFALDSSSDSPGDNSSPGSSSDSPRDHGRNSSVGSAIHSESAINFDADGWLNPQAFSDRQENLFGLDSSMGGFDPNFADIESSNRVMDSAFDFESAASSPTPYSTDGISSGASKKKSRASAAATNHYNQYKAPSMSQHPSGSPFYSNSSREPSPLTTKLPPHGRSGSSQWSGRSPSSNLEDNFGSVSVNTASPFNGTLSPPNLNFVSNGMQFGATDYSASSPGHSNSASRGPTRPILHVHPTSLKSRVETQIPIRLTLFPLPTGVQKLRLPTHTISKPKFLAKPEIGPSPEILELYTSLVCTSAMQDKAKLERAFARARGEAVKRTPNASSTMEGDDDEKPLEGGEVKICQGCIQRERKRASRKKQRKPDEDELFQKDEDKRVIVFNTHEIKDWVEPPKDSSMSFTPPGAMQVELPMRIACYCRHQNEKLGFQVILTIKDHLGNVVAQAITNSIMITDDHKTHSASSAAVSATAPSSALPDGTQLPGAGVFVPGSSQDASKVSAVAQQNFRASSTSDLQNLQQFASQYQITPGAFAIPQPTGSSSSSATPRNLSRQASPTDQPGPSNKRRKHSSSGKLPTGLTMTKLEGPQSTSSSSSSVVNGQFASSSRGFVSPSERPFATPIGVSGPFGNGPPTPNGTDTNPYFSNMPQAQSIEGLAQAISAPGSAHASRPNSPGLNSRHNFGEPAHGLPMAPNPVSQAWPHITNAGNRLPTIIHKLVPAEGSTTGGTEVTLLGSGFYPGMEVVFGDTLATTTTFWGDKCLNCLTPPALQPGLVPVVFKHEHPTFGQVPQTQPILPKQQHFFRYVDDRELQMYRLALQILGQKLRSPTDAFQTAQRIMGGDQAALWNLQNDIQGGSNGQRQVPNYNAQNQTSDLDSKMLTYLEFLDLDDSPRAPRYNSRSSTGLTLLHFASSLGLTRFVAGLLARGATPDVQDKNGHTAMHFAALSGHAHIVHRLRLAGANAGTRSARGFTPADIAITLPAHQAALIPASHYRSRSVGSSPSLRRRHSSSVSLSSYWETSSASGSFNYAQEESEDDQETDSDEEDAEGYFSSRRSSMHVDAPSSLYYTRSREGSVHVDGVNASTEHDVKAERATTQAALVAWRNQLATQIHQFQQSVGRAFPNLPALPPMPALPDYQAYPMMRRITNLVPNRPGSSWSSRDGWWDLLRGNSTPPAATTHEPPAYEELYPHQEADEDRDQELKKHSMIRAAAEAALDDHFEAKPSSSSTSSMSKDEITDIRIGRKTIISREQQEKLRHQQALKMKGLRKDKNLYFFWIPMLLLFLGLWLRNFVPGLWRGVSDGYEFMKNRYIHRTAVGAAT